MGIAFRLPQILILVRTMNKNARVALVASLFLGGCFVDDPAMFDICKSDADCKDTVAVSSCRQISVQYDSGTSTENFCTAGCNNAGLSCDFYSSNGQLAYCAGLTAGGQFTSGAYTSALCMERCYYHSDCSPGFVCVDNKTIDIQPGVAVCIPGEIAVIAPTAPYDYCGSDAECHSTAPLCERVTGKWLEGNYQAFMCTNTCFADTDCPSLTVGGEFYPGRCLDPGVVASSSACAQGCLDDSDCLEGFECADDKEIVGVDPGYNVCVPRL